ncbi:unnamed protein product [Camellia sinensis]
MVEAILLTQSSHILFSNSRFTSHLSPLHLRHSHHHHHRHNTGFNLRVRCEAAARSTTVSSAEIKKKQRKSVYEIENLTTWLLKQEQAGHIDAELTIVLSSISLACKQIASLLQRSSIVNLTGTHGTVNIQGEHQKKLDVISNEVFCNFISIAFHLYSRLLCQFNSTHCPNIGIKTAMVMDSIRFRIEEKISTLSILLVEILKLGMEFSFFRFNGNLRNKSLKHQITDTRGLVSLCYSLLANLSALLSPSLRNKNLLPCLVKIWKWKGKRKSSVFCNCLRSSGRTGIIASEEEDVPVAVEETYSGNYVVVFDPIDGSANIDTALTTGSIFGIYGPDEQCLLNLDDDSMLGQEEQKCIVSVCQPGSNLLAAGYCLYSSAVILTLSLGRGVFGFTLDPGYGEFVLTHEDIKIPKIGKIYSFNEGNYDLWDDKLKKYLNHLKQPGANGKPYSGRYIGCLVGEIHRMLLCGGVYGNPKSKNAKNGNLRLLYECAPMSYLVEQAGGKAIDGHQRILEIKPTQIHQRSSIFIGSPDEIEKLEKYLA